MPECYFCKKDKENTHEISIGKFICFECVLGGFPPGAIIVGFCSECHYAVNWDQETHKSFQCCAKTKHRQLQKGKGHINDEITHLQCPSFLSLTVFREIFRMIKNQEQEKMAKVDDLEEGLSMEVRDIIKPNDNEFCPFVMSTANKDYYVLVGRDHAISIIEGLVHIFTISSKEIYLYPQNWPRKTNKKKHKKKKKKKKTQRK